MDQDTAHKIASMVEDAVRNGGRVLGVTVIPNYDAGKLGDDVLITVDYSVPSAGSSS